MAFRRPARLLLVALVLAGSACSAGGTSEPDPDATLPLPEATDTLLPIVSDTIAVETTASLPQDALFGGDVCAALELRDLSSLGATGRGIPQSIDSCVWEVEAGTVTVQLATEDEFDTPGGGGYDLVPLDGVGLRAVGIDLGAAFEVFVKVENGFFSVTAPTRDAAERLAAVAAPRATRPVTSTVPVTDPEPTDVASSVPDTSTPAPTST